MATSIYRRIDLFQVSNTTLIFKIDLLTTEIKHFVSGMSLLRNQIQGKLIFRFVKLNSQLGRQIFQISIFFLMGYLEEKAQKGSPQLSSSWKKLSVKAV